MEAEGAEFEEDKLFYDVVGGHDKKKRLYGLGSFAKAVPNRNGKTDVSYIPEKNNEIEEMRELVAKQNEQNEELKEIMKSQQQQNNARVGHLEKQLQTAMDLINVFTKQQH